MKKLQIHLAKKRLEVHLEGFPAIPRFSWRHAWLSHSCSLPKGIQPGLKPPQPRNSCLSFGLAKSNHIEFTLQRRYFLSLWGLGIKYVETVAGLAPALQLGAKRTFSPARRREDAFECTEKGTLVFLESTKAVLETHIRKKKIQHEWGFPSLIQRSLKCFHGDISLGHRSKTVTQVSVLLYQELFFLPQKVRCCLEFHIQRMKLQRRWGLPKRVLESSRRLLLGLSQPKKESFSQELVLGIKAPAVGHVHPRQEEKKARKTEGVTCPAHPHLRLKNQDVKKLQIHLAKKCLEVHLEGFPAIPKFSWRHVRLSFNCSLPKVIQPGLKPLQPRRSTCLSFGLAKSNQIEFALQRSHFFSLWGLGVKYVDVMATMWLGGSLSPAKLRAVTFEGLEGKTPFLEGSVQENLEMHVKMKMLQQERGFPSLVQGSIEEAPLPPSLPKGAAQIFFLHQKLQFLPENVKHNLELHVQRMKLQRQWGLPKRIHQALKFSQPPGLRKRPGEKCDLSTQATRVEMPIIQPKKDVSCILESHLRKKSLEIKFQIIEHKAFIGPLKHTSLPKCPCLSSEICPRTSHLTFVEQKDLENIDLNIKRKHLIQLWDLPSLYTKSLNKMVELPQKVSMLRRRATEKSIGPESQKAKGIKPSEMASAALCSEAEGLTMQFSPDTVNMRDKVTVSFLDPAMEKELDSHVRSRTASHRWSVPGRLQKPLKVTQPPPSPLFTRPQQSKAKSPQHMGVIKRAPLDQTPQGKTLRYRGEIQKNALKEATAPTFIKKEGQDLLEKHLQRKRSQKEWGVPLLVQTSLHAFSPPPPKLPKSIQDSLREKIPPPQITGQKNHWESHIKRDPQCGSDRQKGSLQWVTSLKETSHNSMESIPQRIPDGSTTALRTPEVKLLFPSHESRELLESHLIHKRIQHEWGQPLTVLRSLQMFAPFLPDPLKLPEKNIAKVSPRGKQDVETVAQNVLFLSPDIGKNLETNVEALAVKHRWRIPKQVLWSRQAFLPARPSSQSALAQSQSPWPRKYGPSQKTLDGSQTSDNEEEPLQKSMPKSVRMEMPTRASHIKEDGAANATTFLNAKTKLPFLPVGAKDLLEFHIQHKKIQHAWGLPSILLRSMQAFAPFYLKSEKDPGGIVTKILPGDRGEVQTINQDLGFLSTDRKERLEAHLKCRTMEHRWGLPKRVQQSLMAFLPPRSCSQYKTDQRLQPRRNDFQIKVNNKESQQKAKSPWEAVEKPKMRFYHEKTSLHVEVKQYFLPDKIQVFLEFHIQQKKIQHVWGLPTAILKSLHAFSPCILNPKKCAGKMVTKRFLQVRGKVQHSSQGISFLRLDIKEHLEVHLRHIITKHRWGLPEKVLKSLPPRLPFHLGVATSHPFLLFPSSSIQVTRDNSKAEDKKGQLQERKPRWEGKGLQKKKECSLSWKTKPGKMQHKTALQQRPVLSLKDTRQVRHSKFSDGTEEPGNVPAPPSTSRTKVHMHSCGHSKLLPSFQKVRYGNGRTTPSARKKEPIPWCSKTSLQEKTCPWQPEERVQQSAKWRDSLTKLPKPSAARSKQRKSCKMTGCPCSCHLSAPREVSASLSQYAGEQNWRRKQNEDAVGKRAEAAADSLSPLTEGNEAQRSLSSGDNMEQSFFQEPETTQTYHRPLEADVQPDYPPFSPKSSNIFLHSSRDLTSFSSYEDVTARHYKRAGREDHVKWNSTLQRKRRRLMWSKKRREFHGQSLGDPAKCQTPSGTKLLSGWSSKLLYEKFLCLKHPPLSKENRCSMAHQGAETSKESKEDSTKNQVSIADDVESHMPLGSCGLALASDNDMREGKVESATFTICREQCLSFLGTTSQSSPKCKGRRIEDWDKDKTNPLEINDGGRSKLAEETFQEEMGRWKCADSSVVSQPQILTENIALSLLALSEEARAISSYKKLGCTAAEAVLEPPGDHGTPKQDEILETSLKDEISREKRHASREVRQTEVLGQHRQAKKPVSKEADTMHSLLQKTRKEEESGLIWDAQVVHQDLLVVKGLVSKPKHCLVPETPRKGKVPGKGSWERTRTELRSGEHRCFADEKMSILSKILEKKLNLWQGLSIWRQNTRWKQKKGECSNRRDRKKARRWKRKSRYTKSFSMDKKWSVRSSILEKKMNLWHGLCIWRNSREKAEG